MLTVFARAAILYFVSVVAMRLMGKRQVGQLQPYELVLAIMIADLAASPMESVGTPLLYGIVPILALMTLHGLEELISLRSLRARRLLSGEPSVIIRRGAIEYEEMKRLCFTMSDLMNGLREQGYLNIAEVCTAILETSGKLTVFPHARNRPVQPEDMSIAVPYEGIPLPLVLEGKPQMESFRKAGLDENWLRKRLLPLSIKELSELLLCSLDTKGMLYVQRKSGEMHLIEALPPERAVW